MKIVVLVGVNVFVNTSWLGIGTALASVPTNPRTGRIRNVAFAALLILSVAYVALK